MKNDKDFRSRMQMGETGLSQDYFNCILVIDPDIIHNPRRYYAGGEAHLRSHLVSKLNELKTYSEYIKEVVARKNRPSRDCDGNLNYPENLLCLEDFVGDENREQVKKLDDIVISMKKFGVSEDKINFQELLDLMKKGILLIYGLKYAEAIDKRFSEDPFTNKRYNENLEEK